MLLGQNVNSYRDLSGTEDSDKMATKLSNDGFRTGMAFVFTDSPNLENDAPPHFRPPHMEHGREL